MATSLFNLLQDTKVIIPIIQRDYVQGRANAKVSKIRERFLNAIFESLKENADPLVLDFVYGYMNGNDNSHHSSNTPARFTPLDGQQRLTTLFLLHWYIAVKENKMEEAREFLSKFSYETRHSSRVFCEELVKFVPEELDSSIRDTIINQPWFFVSWEKEPTINSMLTMLDAIQEKVIQFNFRAVNIWPLLIADLPRIGFHLLQMDKLGLPDDLYIKMNSRGKELTEFEYFKSQFSEFIDTKYTDKFKTKIDLQWSDLFWNLYKEEESSDIAKLVDNGFIRFFNYITDMLIFKQNIDVEHLLDDFDIYSKVYETEESVIFLFSSLDAFGSVSSTIPEFFEEIFYTDEGDFNQNRTRLFFRDSKSDLFKKCADNYNTSEHINPFSIGEQLMLYACLIYLQNKTSDFNTKIRKIRNLITNSEDTVRKEKMTNLLTSVESIVMENTVSPTSEFNNRQIDEENNKEEFLQLHPELKESIFRLEDHHLLQGCLAIFDFDDQFVNSSNAFIDLFNPKFSYDTISRAMLTFGDYSQKYGWRRRLGNHNDSVWRELFTPSNRRDNFANTKNVLQNLISKIVTDPDILLGDIIDHYLAGKESESDKLLDWSYYYIKYSSFRKNEDGFYYWPIPGQQYNCIMMRRSTLGGFNWSPFLYELNERFKVQVSLETYGNPLLIIKDNSTLKMTHVNTGYKIETDDDSINIFTKIQQKGLINSAGVFEISQNLEGLDKEDRVEIGKKLISEILNL